MFIGAYGEVPVRNLIYLFFKQHGKETAKTKQPVIRYMQATRAWLEAHLPTATVYGAGLNVYTALDVVAQRKTERVLNEKVAYMESQLGRSEGEPLQAAGAMVDPYTGALVAVYGGRDATSTSFNRATQARRQAGSAFKPMVYALAFSRTDGDGMPARGAATAARHVGT